MITFGGRSVRFYKAGYSEEAVLNRTTLFISTKHVLLYKPSILLANTQAISNTLILYKKKNSLFELYNRIIPM